MAHEALHERPSGLTDLMMVRVLNCRSLDALGGHRGPVLDEHAAARAATDNLYQINLRDHHTVPGGREHALLALRERVVATLTLDDAVLTRGVGYALRIRSHLLDLIEA